MRLENHIYLRKKKLEKHLFSPTKAGKKIFLFCGHPAWAIGVMRYSGGIIDWTKEELQDMDQKT